MYEPSPYRQRQPSTYPDLVGGGQDGYSPLHLWTIFAPVPGPIDDFAVWAFGAYSAMRGLMSEEPP
jgi:hypothetical protein